jgi:hypothetical protein
MVSVHCYVRTWFMDAMIISICFVFSKLLRVVYCFVIITVVGGANVQHYCYTYYVAGIQVYHRRIV